MSTKIEESRAGRIGARVYGLRGLDGRLDGSRLTVTGSLPSFLSEEVVMMATRGRPAKPEGQSRHRPTKAEREAREARAKAVEARSDSPVAAVAAPRLTEAGRYRSETLRYWRTWRASSQAASFTAQDWERLRLLLPVVDAYWAGPDVKLLGEIRRVEATFGAPRQAAAAPSSQPVARPAKTDGDRQAKIMKLLAGGADG